LEENVKKKTVGETPCKCPSEFAPVCTDDGITYNNVCEAKCAKGQNVKFYSTCNATCSQESKCPCYYNPVCGTDGVTYENSCHAKLNGVAVSVSGECVACL